MMCGQIMMKFPLLSTSVVALLGAFTSRGDDVVPAHPSFDRYSAMVDRSPFAVATAVAVPAATPDFAKDLYVANAARFPGGDMVTIASSSDQKFKKYLTTGQPVDGFTLGRIEWSDRVGATKVTIRKGEKFATLTFNQALLAQRAAPKAPPAPDQVPQNMPVSVPSMPFPEQSKATRGVIQQNPNADAAPTPNPTPESPQLPDPPNYNPKSPEQRTNEKLELQREMKADSLRPVAPTPQTDENDT